MVKDNLSPLSGGRIKCLLILVIAAIATSGGAGQAWAQPAATTTTLAVASGGSAVTTLTSGSVVTLTATVLAGTTPVTVGQVNFCNAAATHCTDINVLATAQITSAGTAVFKFRPGVGSHTYKAVFLGTPNGAKSYAGSSSGTAALIVTGPYKSSTALSGPGNFEATEFGLGVYYSPYTLTVTVLGPTSTALTGTVSILDASNGNAVLGTASLGASTGFNYAVYSTSETVYPTCCAVAGDFNGDGIPDVAVAVLQVPGNWPYSGAVAMLLGDGTGNFNPVAASTQAGNNPVYIVASDFNGDGNLDLAMVGQQGGFANVSGLSVLLGNGDGTFSNGDYAIASNNLFGALAVGDFNLDGIQDIAVVNFLSGTVSILLGNGDGNFTQTAVSPQTGPAPYSIVVADFNGDGIPDLAVAISHSVTILLGNGDGTFNAAPSLPASCSVTAGDFNGDGILDLVIGGIVFLGNGDGTFKTPAGSLPGGCPDVPVAVADFNGDGIPDLVWGGNTVSLGNGDGTFTSGLTLPFQANSPAVADFNGDGIPDVASPEVNNDALDVALIGIQSASVTVQGIAPSGQGEHLLVASYTGDGNYDPSTGSQQLNVRYLIPEVTATPSSSNVALGQSLTVTIAVLDRFIGFPTATGSVVLTSGSYASSAATLDDGSATIVIPAGALAPGTDTLTAAYSGDLTYQPTTGTATVIVAGPPGFALSGTGVGAGVGNTSTITVTPAGGFTGSVVLTAAITSSPAGATSPPSLSFGSSTPVSITGTSPGTATLTVTTTTATTPGVYTVTVTGTSGSITGTTTITVTVAKAIPTVTVTPSSSNITTAQGLTVTVAVSAGASSPTPTGSVTLTSGAYSSAATTLSSGSAAINIPAYSLSTGSVTLTASYSPDSSSSEYSSASGVGTVFVSTITPTVTVTPFATSIPSTQPLQVDISVSGPSGDPTPTGSVDLTSGNYDSGSVMLSAGSAAINIPASSLSPGNDTLGVSYTPDSTGGATYGSALGDSPVTVTASDPTPVVGSMSPAVQTAGSAAFTLTVNGSGFIPGSTIYWGTSALTTQFGSAGQIAALIPASGIESSGTDSITVENPSPGGGTSNTLQFEVDSSGAGSPSFAVVTATVTPGQSATYSVTLPSAATAVTASCLNLPSGASCSFSSSAGTVTIATSSTTPAGTYQVTMVFTETVPGAASSFVLLPILLLPLLLFRRKWNVANIGFTACLGLVLMAAAAGVGCGSGAAGAPPVAPTHEVTTAGAVTLTVQ